MRPLPKIGTGKSRNRRVLPQEPGQGKESRSETAGETANGSRQNRIRRKDPGRHREEKRKPEKRSGQAVGEKQGQGRERLDILVTERGLAPSREKARALIMAGCVFVNGQKEDKAGARFARDCGIEVAGHSLRYVSRGGLKLEKALAVFPTTPSGKICMDVGASTGGFTDCMLQNGALKVYAVDVGYGQLDWGLRNDPRVVCMEKTNIRYVTPEDLPEKMDFVSVDVAFISLTKVLGPAWNLIKPQGQMVCLIKPQFEAGREKVGKKGVVKDPAVHREVIGQVAECAFRTGFIIKGLDYSPVKGPEGNIEYLLYLEKDTASSGRTDTQESFPDAAGVVEAAHTALDRKE